MAKKYKSIILSVTIVSIVILLTTWTPPSAASQKPIKIGFMGELSGVYAREGYFMDRALRLAIQEAGNKIAGRNVMVISEDQEMKPDVAITKARKLVERDGCQILVGCYASSCALAVRDYVHSRKVPYMTLSGASTFLLRTTKKSPYVWLGGMSAGQNMYALPYYLAKEKGFKQAIVMVPEYSYGLDCAAFYKGELERAGGKVIQEIHTPFPTMNFSPYIASFKVKDADVIYPDYSGADAVRVVRQIKEAGISLPIGGCGTFMPGTVEMMDPNDADGGWGSNPWIPEIPSPKNQAFLKAYRTKYKDEPGVNAAVAYASAWALINAIKAVNGNVEDTDAFLKALSEVNYDSIWGNWFFEKETHAAVLHNYVFRVEKADNKIRKVIVYHEKEARVGDVLRKLGKLPAAAK
jgi:branched-chain amino acid transport system substrate-binding protein